MDWLSCRPSSLCFQWTAPHPDRHRIFPIDRVYRQCVPKAHPRPICKLRQVLSELNGFFAEQIHGMTEVQLYRSARIKDPL